MNSNCCPLCFNKKVEQFCEDKLRVFVKCKQCNLIFVFPQYFLSETKEKNRYDMHENSELNSGYLKHLTRVVEPLEKVCLKGAKGLDFGCGSNPVLANVLNAKGYEMEIYDYFYFNNNDFLQKKYDFVTATEVVEHLFEPGKELHKLWSIINNKGAFVVMTRLYNKEIDFLSWFYKNDLTHVCFFSKETFFWIAGLWNAKVSFFDKDIVVLKKTKQDLTL